MAVEGFGAVTSLRPHLGRHLSFGVRPFSGPKAPWLAAWAAVIAVGLLSAADADGQGLPLGIVAAATGVPLLLLTLFGSLAELRDANARTRAALTRATAAEAAERSRAEQLAEQLNETMQMQQQLITAGKLAAIGELASAVAHEVNNPLTGILGFAELLESGLDPTDPHREDVAVIRAEALRARAIVRALLEFARPRAPERVTTPVNAMVKSSVDLVRFRAQEAGVEVVEDYRQVPDLELDPDALKQVLVNLFNNAFDAMPGGGRLRVSTRSDHGRVAIAVADNGVGMDAATRSRIFAPFFTTRAGPGGGTGLGLSVSLRIVESHGGTMEVQSETGHGSTFTVWLPRAVKGGAAV